MTNSTIRFVKLNRMRRPIGSLDSELGYGVHDTLVQRGIAEWVSGPDVTKAVITEPVAVGREIETEQPRDRKARRYQRED